MTDGTVYQIRPLNEAEETIEAIHYGKVDALVVRGPEGPQIVMLQNDDQPYRMLVERMSDGALTLGPDDRILYANRRLADLTGEPVEKLVGRTFASLFTDNDPGLADGSVISAQLQWRDTSLPVSVWSSPIQFGGMSARLVTVTDLAVQHRVQEIAGAERFARSILEQSTEAIVVLAPDGRITHASQMAEDIAVCPPVGRSFSEAFFIDGRPPAKIGALAEFPRGSLDASLATKPFHGVELKLSHTRKGERSFLLSAGPLLDDAKRTIGAIVTLTDITERKRAEEQQTMLVAELNHRVKNILAVVQAVAAQTVRTSPSLDSFKGTFAGRIKALSIAHDILTRTRWSGIGLGELLGGVLSPYRTSDETRVRLEGPPVLLPAHAVVPLSMALHELATNASKYGALSCPQGSVAVLWRPYQNDTAEVEIDWHEQAGPKIAAGKKSGFGTTLIQRVVNHDLEGTVDLDFAPEGMRAVLRFPLRTHTDLNDLSGGAQQ